LGKRNLEGIQNNYVKKVLIKFKNIRSPQHSGEKLLLSTLSILKKTNSNPQKLLATAIARLRPGVKILIRIRAGRVIPLPAYQREESANYWAIRWLLQAAQERTNKSFVATDLVGEIRDTLKKRGRAYKSKVDLIKEIREARVNLHKKFRRFKRIQKKRKIWDSLERTWKTPLQMLLRRPINPIALKIKRRNLYFKQHLKNRKDPNINKKPHKNNHKFSNQKPNNKTYKNNQDLGNRNPNNKHYKNNQDLGNRNPNNKHYKNNQDFSNQKTNNQYINNPKGNRDANNKHYRNNRENITYQRHYNKNNNENIPYQKKSQ